MCGRFAFYSPKEAVAALFGVALDEDPPARFNIAPTQSVLGLRRAAAGGLEAAWFRWGLVPFWAKDAAIGNRMINARIETLAEKPAYRQALVQRRCVILASGFYEWRATRGAKIPCFLARRDGAPFAIAGLWERWDKDEAYREQPLETCTLVTVPAQGAVRDVHGRMPLILSPDAARAWVEAPAGPAAELLNLLPVPDADALSIVEVSRAVNNPRNEGPELVRAAGS